MQIQSACSKPLCHLPTDELCLRFRSAVNDNVVRIPLERNLRMVCRHPQVERVMQEHVRQQGRDHATLWSALPSVGSCSIHRFRRCLQPALDVKPDPRAVRVLAYYTHYPAIVDM